MNFSVTSLMNAINQLVSHEQEQVSAERSESKMGSLQDHLISVSRETSRISEVRSEASESINELSVGPPPLYRKDRTSNVVGMPKKKGSRVIFWTTQVVSTDRAA